MDAQCVLCQEAGGEVLAGDEMCRVILANEPGYPGLCRVVLNAHVAEMTELPAEQQIALMQRVFAVERVIRATLDPDKINLASLGNVVPHLHWHVIPRWHGDRHFPDPIWAAPRRPDAVSPVTAAQLTQLRAQIRVLFDASLA
ncbi:Diadenosine tetraphosphate (Ap4A) hydrolase [Andreprevotia lacus DSM 23236]|uniref:Diadenosine tetraphosphate (Ap4A) hydrolase n=1 Tax=Andreprevotia lacus DSM 23236 TaxID=1121001 RepID=A0A1W1X327_9NEIS|nr:HIT family protein [Andreprevotia lacus]SMC18366.1 Diadenosine tetraphosphate (Ap4A) hydrolase [Andreprevotia lacus DSM 23236]